MARSAKTEGAALSEAERGMADMSEKFKAVGGELYVSESGTKREAIDELGTQIFLSACYAA
ncbi:MAG: hypothetical protein Q8R63_03540 [Ramlibacter sp.]|nr:hypothetical protein [Ramlibacter sp.]